MHTRDRLAVGQELQKQKCHNSREVQSTNLRLCHSNATAHRAVVFHVNVCDLDVRLVDRLDGSVLWIHPHRSGLENALEYVFMFVNP